MADSLNAFFPSLVAAVGEAQKVGVATNVLVDAVYKRIDPLPGPVGTSVTVPIPARRTAVNIGASAFQFNDLSTQFSNSIGMTNVMSDAFTIPSLDQFQSPQELREIYLDPSIKAVLTGIDSSLVGDVASFTTSQTNAGGTAKLFSVPNFLAARQQLATNLVDVTDVKNMWYIQNEVPYHAQLDDEDWVKQTTVGQSIAESIRSTGQFPYAFSTNIAYDQNFAAVTQSGSVVSYPGVLFHSYGIALASRPQPTVQSNDYLKVIDLPIRGLMFRIMLWFSPENNAYCGTVSCMYGHANVRPDWGIKLSTLVSP